MIVELLFCSNQAPGGISLTVTTCLLFGLGYMFATILVSLFVVSMVEFPLTRILQLTIIPYITHDFLLASKHEKKLVKDSVIQAQPSFREEEERDFVTPAKSNEI